MDKYDIDLCYRVRELRKSIRMNQTEFGNKIDVAQSYLTNIETAKRPVTDKIFKLICLQSWNGKFVNENWLRTGEGEMFLELPPEDEIAAAISEVLEDIHCKNSFYTLIKEILVQHERLDDESQKQIDSFFDNVLQGIQEKREEP